ncbi:MAG: DUF4249 domain-containing protein [Bacteroidales bacterium]|nr:DUF4249 domain-containing protein [Bacteroidales bacterium]
MKIKYLILFAAIMCFACKEEFQLDSSNNQSLIVIEGFVSNEPGPYTINVSRSSQLDEPELNQITGCQVILKTDNGVEEVLTEIEPGKYVSDKDGIKGEVGHKYKLSVSTKENEIYETEFQEMKEPIEISSLYIDVDTIESNDNPDGLSGYQFLIDTKVASSTNSYLLWKLTESYEYVVDYKLYGIWNGSLYVVNQDTLFNFNDTYRCWNTQDIKNIFTANMANLSYPEISKKKLHFVGTDSKRLTIKYSVLVNQYSINEETYGFWKGVEDQMSEDNYLYSSQPHNIRSNITNINKPEEVVLGFFTVASVSKQRIYVDNEFSQFSYEKSFVITDPTVIYDPRRPIPRYFVKTEDGILGEVQRSAFDCRKDGGETTKPYFWTF